MSLSFNFLLIKRAEQYPLHRVVVKISGADSVKGPAAYRAQCKCLTTISLLSVSLSLCLSLSSHSHPSGWTYWSKMLRIPEALSTSCINTFMTPLCSPLQREVCYKYPHTGEHRWPRRGFPISSFHRTGSHCNSHPWEGRHASLGHWVMPGCQRCSMEAP